MIDEPTSIDRATNTDRLWRRSGESPEPRESPESRKLFFPKLKNPNFFNGLGRPEPIRAGPNCPRVKTVLRPIGPFVIWSSP